MFLKHDSEHVKHLLSVAIAIIPPLKTSGNDRFAPICISDWIPVAAGMMLVVKQFNFTDQINLVYWFTIHIATVFDIHRLQPFGILQM